MIGTAAALALSRKSPSGAVIFEQTCLGSSQRALRSSTKIAVLLLSRVSGFGGPVRTFLRPSARGRQRDPKKKESGSDCHVDSLLPLARSLFPASADERSRASLVGLGVRHTIF